MTRAPCSRSARPRARQVGRSGRGGLVAVLLLLVAGCGSGQAAPSGPRVQTITVFAAASLQKAFTAEARAYEASRKGMKVELSFAGSQSLVAQVRQGAPVDVLATADLATMGKVADRLTGAPVVFAHNELALITAEHNPLGLMTLKDLARKDLKVVLAGPTVPVGKATAAALVRAGVTVQPVSLEDAVSGVVTKVRLGEADAGIAYASDLVGSGLGGAPLAGTRTSLAIGALTGAAAEAFIAYVQSPAGQAVLKTYGFR
jgi:molybdate transport system substrate-binding protein